MMGLVWAALPILDDRSKAYEQRFVGALHFTETTVETALDLNADLHKPKIAQGAKPELWVISGLLVSMDNLGGSTRAPLSALLESVCAEVVDPACWRMVELQIDNRVVAASLAATVPEMAPEMAPEFAPEMSSESLPEAAPEPAAAEIAEVEANGGTSGEVNGEAAAQIAATTGEAGSSDSGDSGEESLPNQTLIRFIQDALAKLRYDPGPVDGKMGARTTSAIEAYQRDFDLEPDGRPSVELLRHLRGRLDDLEQQSGDSASADEAAAG